MYSIYHDVRTWKHPPHNWLFMRGLHWLPVDCTRHVARNVEFLISPFMLAWTCCWINSSALGELGRPCRHNNRDLMQSNSWVWKPWRSCDHDDVITWKHFLCYWPFVRGIHRSPVDSPHKGQWHGALIFSLIWAWTNTWTNNRNAGDLRCHRDHYDVIVICCNLRTYINV